MHRTSSENTSKKQQQLGQARCRRWHWHGRDDQRSSASWFRSGRHSRRVTRLPSFVFSNAPSDSQGHWGLILAMCCITEIEVEPSIRESHTRSSNCIPACIERINIVHLRHINYFVYRVTRVTAVNQFTRFFFCEMGKRDSLWYEYGPIPIVCGTKALSFTTCNDDYGHTAKAKYYYMSLDPEIGINKWEMPLKQELLCMLISFKSPWYEASPFTNLCT